MISLETILEKRSRAACENIFFGEKLLTVSEYINLPEVDKETKNTAYSIFKEQFVDYVRKNPGVKERVTETLYNEVIHEPEFLGDFHIVLGKVYGLKSEEEMNTLKTLAEFYALDTKDKQSLLASIYEKCIKITDGFVSELDISVDHSVKTNPDNAEKLPALSEEELKEQNEKYKIRVKELHKRVSTPEYKLKHEAYEKAREVRDAALSNLKHLKKLDVHGVIMLDISFLSNLTELEELKIDLNYHTKDVSYISKCSNLKRLDVVNNTEQNLSSIAELKDLECLTIEDNKSLDYSFLDSLHKLKHLDVEHTAIDNFSFLKNMKELEYLAINSGRILELKLLDHKEDPAEEDSAFMRSDLINPETKAIMKKQKREMKQRRDAEADSLAIITEAVSELYNLKHLEIMGIYATKDLSPFKNMKNLEYLAIKSGRLEDISLLNTFEKLTYFETNFYGIEDLSPLIENNRHYSSVDDIKAMVDRLANTGVRKLTICNTGSTDINDTPTKRNENEEKRKKGEESLERLKKLHERLKTDNDENDLDYASDPDGILN